MKIAILVLALVGLIQADMYLHNPRGSNNRLDEARRDRNNGNRMFDSQNNNRGGYNVGSLYYYAGSVLSVEWTNQHSCGDQNNHCEIIFQYMCDENVRDGASTKTIPTNPILCEDYDCNTDLEYGMHETFDYYLNCRLRKRNMGLFTADRNLNNKQNARFTRQNQNGNRRGYECPEERDYYPYWHPTPWRDIAVLTNDATRCPYYQTESANVKSRYACIMPKEYIRNHLNGVGNSYRIPNTQDECERWTWIDPTTQNETHAVWQEFPPDSRLSAPECVESLWSRDNHLGNGMGGYANLYNWTIPDLPHEHCVFRARYNISTAEYDGWDSSINSSILRRSHLVFNEATNQVNDRETISELDVYSQFGFNFTTAKARGYVFHQNPIVKIFDDPSQTSSNFGLQLAINTNQFGRTFQDRSHTFAIRSKPDDIECDNIYNLNVRGKRGNIVQTYPGVEYDFVPNVLHASVGSCVHIQWTGSNTNPNNNDGQGKEGTDRSNIVLLRSMNYDEGTPGAAVPTSEKFGHYGNSYPQHLNHSETFLNLDPQLREHLAMLSPSHFGGEMSELDDAGTYFDLGLRKVTQRGTYHYMCSRNNNFTNRSQKGKAIITETAMTNKRIGWNGGTVENGGNMVTIQRGTLNSPQVVGIEKYSSEEQVVNMTGNKVPGMQVSDYISVEGLNLGQRSATVQMSVSPMAALDSNTQIYRANRNSQWAFLRLNSRAVNGMIVADTSEDGVFVVAQQQVAIGVSVATAALIIGVLALAIVGLVIYFRVRPEKWTTAKDKVSGGLNNVKRSFAKKV